ncbi:hypothetical protein COBT_000130 [Conglomerata obtusa]
MIKDYLLMKHLYFLSHYLKNKCLKIEEDYKKQHDKFIQPKEYIFPTFSCTKTFYNCELQKYQYPKFINDIIRYYIKNEIYICKNITRLFEHNVVHSFYLEYSIGTISLQNNMEIPGIDMIQFRRDKDVWFGTFNKTSFTLENFFSCLDKHKPTKAYSEFKQKVQMALETFLSDYFEAFYQKEANMSNTLIFYQAGDFYHKDKIAQAIMESLKKCMTNKKIKK